MTSYYWTGHVFVFREVEAGILEAWADAVLDELEATDVRDVSVGGSLTQGRVEFEFCVPAANADDVFEQAAMRMKAALVTAGTLATDWAALPIDEESVTIRRRPEALSA